MSIQENKAAKAASKFINHTHQHVFLTGKAGTGKTTFLKHIVKHTYKKTIITAPTGIAAINAGGVTLHSLLQLPYGGFIPQHTANTPSQAGMITPVSLHQGFRMHDKKRKLLREVELIIIDEVSMLRADLLDAVDQKLQKIRKNPQPFGGVQLLLIGDLLQLPPVISDNEWNCLRTYYNSVHFFDALALKEHPPVLIELDKIYRQSDDKFICILNNLRNNVLTEEDQIVLNNYHKSNFTSKPGDGYIFLNTHNAGADSINANELAQLPGNTSSYSAEIKGTFTEGNFPIEKELILKEGAQVIFIKNDSSHEKRFYNGKLGQIHRLNNDEIWVDLNDGQEPIKVEPFTWENTRFELNEESGEIEEKSIGSFKHYPLKLAWAITIHKSQGLTFDKAVIDVSKAFAPGQIYVALSRLTSLDGLVLNQPIQANNLKMDMAVSSYLKNKPSREQLINKFRNASLQFIGQQVLDAFNMNPLIDFLSIHLASYDKENANRSTKQKFLAWAKDLYQQMDAIHKTAASFQSQLQQLMKAHDLNQLQNRVSKASDYFYPLLKECYILVLDQLRLLKDAKRIKSYREELEEIDRLIFKQIERMQKANAFVTAHHNNLELDKDQFLNASFYIEREEALTSRKIITSTITKEKKVKKSVKSDKQPTAEISFELYNSGKSITEIAEHRALTTSTIAAHLTKFIELGKLSASSFMSIEKVTTIKDAAASIETEGNWKPLKDFLGDDYSYADIKMVMAEIRSQDQD